LNAFLRFLIESDVIRPEVLCKRMIIKVPDALPRAMDPDDVKQLLCITKDIRDRAMILVLLRTGMRIGELLNTLVSEVNLKERKIEIYEAEKNRVGRVVYLSKDASDALKAWLKKRDPNKAFLFYAQGRERMSYGAARMRFKKYVDKASVSHKGYTLHSLRHTFATELLNAGMRLECLQQLLGHSCVEMTRRYARLTDKTREEEYFRAMAIIERGEKNERYQLNRELQATHEKTQLLASHVKELYEHP
jgi:site-specific recombinase XerD